VNARSAQLVAAGLGFVLIVLVGAVIFILLSRPAQGPRVSPDPSAVANVSPSASALPTFSFSPFPTVSQLPTSTPIASNPPTLSPTPVITLPPPPTLPPTPSPTPSPPPTPTAPPVPNAPARELRLIDMGLDARTVIGGGVERFLVFTTDGPTVVRAELSEATARSRVCLWVGTDIAGRQCDTMRNGAIQVPVFDNVSRQWTVSLIGANETSAPTVDLTLDFNANAPLVDFTNLRYQGTTTPAYNGLTATVDTLATGQLTLNGSFDPGQLHNYDVSILEAGLGEVEHVTSEAPVASFSVTHDVTAETSYLVAITNPNPSAEPTPVFLHLTFGWP
jgi:hypothetical protein